MELRSMRWVSLDREMKRQDVRKSMKGLETRVSNWSFGAATIFNSCHHFLGSLPWLALLLLSTLWLLWECDLSNHLPVCTRIISSLDQSTSQWLTPWLCSHDSPHDSVAMCLQEAQQVLCLVPVLFLFLVSQDIVWQELRVDATTCHWSIVHSYKDTTHCQHTTCTYFMPSSLFKTSKTGPVIPCMMYLWKATLTVEV